MGFLSQNWDMIAFVVVTFIHIFAWIENRKEYKCAGPGSESEREFAAASLNNACVSGITAVSILIPASLLLAQFGAEQKMAGTTQLDSIFRASMWFLLSLLLGLFILFMIPMKGQAKNVTREIVIGILFGPQLFSLFIGIVWLVLSIHDIVK